MTGYPQTLKYFMWSWQVYFRISAQTSAESLFNQLDKELKPNVFLIGFLEEEIDNRLPVCIEPEVLDYSINEFKNIQTIADDIYRTSEDRKLFYTGEGMQEEMNLRSKRKSYRLALEKILNESKNNSNKICFASSAVLVEGYAVFVIVELDINIYKSHFHLSYVNVEERIKIYHSLLETAKDTFLEDIVINLHLPDPGKNMSFDLRSSYDLLREAAKQFMYTISWAGKEGQGIHGLFPACNKISTLRYEGDECKGYLIIAKKNHPDIEMTLEIDIPFTIHNHRKTRKFLQLSNEKVGVICNSYEVLGLGRIKKSYNPTNESIFSIFFKDIHCWDVVHNNTTLMQLRYGLPQFSQEIINKKKYFSDAKRVFPEITEDEIKNLYNISILAATQKKGAMLIISRNAKSEAERLSKQCINIKATKVTSELLMNLTSIDGGVLIDVSGIVYAHGVILDGIVGHSGDSSRGSRYNSALTYQEYNGFDNPTIIVVISEDGMVNVIPELMPKIKHSEISHVIGILEKLTSDVAFDRSTFYKSMEWLKNRQFYLTETECKKINDFKIKLEELDKTYSEATLWVIHEDLTPNPQMSNEYYYDE
jgi:hypothetical protein